MKVQKIAKTLFLTCIVILAGCSEDADKDTPTPQAKRISEFDFSKTEGSRSRSIQSVAKKHTGGSLDEIHPSVEEGITVDRGIVVPKEVEKQWKAVKIMVRNKTDESRSSMKTTPLGSSFKIEGSAIKVKVGPFMPNFVMTQNNYTSKGNELTNPAVRLVVEENGKTLYEGWAFAKYPTMYAFEHEEFAFQLMDYIPTDVS
tara:strand:+ start:61 stop:663 length:603 start_codon:yes stop_codon:yes gene_type:complete